MTSSAIAHRRISRRLELSVLRHQTRGPDFAESVRAGLTGTPKTLPPRLLYDPLGSVLFDAICLLPEYYLTRVESEILEADSRSIIEPLASPVRLIELGSGSSTKTPYLLEAILERQETLEYVPIDVSQSALVRSSRELLNVFPGLSIRGTVADYFEALHHLEKEPAPEGVSTLVLFLGSSIGNLDGAGARNLLRSVRKVLSQGDAFLLGADLKKPEELLLPAYDDVLGITAAFNRNLLVRMNQELDAGFDLAAFGHRVRYDDGLGRVEMHLESFRDQTIPIRALELQIPFAAGETIHTESSHKYDPDQLHSLAADTGFHLVKSWHDPAHRFSENLLLAT